MNFSIAVGEPLTPQQHGSSPRVGAVWARDVARKSPESATARAALMSGSLTPDAMVNKRRAAAEFIKLCTGHDVPYSNDLSFRKALADGTLLCQALNKVVPNAVKADTGSDLDAHANVHAFLEFVSDKLQLPSEAKFSLEDLLSEGYDDRTRVVDCLLCLKKMHSSGRSPSPSPLAPFLMGEPSDVRAVRDSPRKAGANPAVDLSSVFAQQFPQQQQQMAVVPSGPRTLAAMQPNANVAMLFSTLTSSLQAKMAPGMQVQRIDSSLSGVMEQFLNGLTAEYERRLLGKDQELTASRDEVARQAKRMAAMQAHLDMIETQMEDQKRVAVASVTHESEDRLRQLQADLSEARALLAQRGEQLAVLQAQLGSRDDQGRERELIAQARAAELQERLDALAGIEQRFAAVREENKKLYNTIQDLKGSIRVFCRVRPLGTTGDATPGCLTMGTEGDIAVYDKSGERKVFRFDRVFDGSSTQADVYEDVETLIRSVMDGYNVCIFAYGQTGSGKTHTMTGSRVDDLSGRGINYRALDDLFALQAERDVEMEYEIKAQMLEIYNETLRDLLAEDQGAANRLELKSTLPSGLNVPGVTQIRVATTRDVLNMMRVGARNRHSAETKMNERSSRSHQVLTIIVDGVNRQSGARSHACLHLVDLAGSERTDKSGVEGDRMREANAINTSLSALGKVMNSLAAKSKHVPFRDSKLTELLTDSLSGNAKVLMFMHVAPEGSSFGETMSTLNFGKQVANVTLGQVKCNAESGKVFEAQEAAAKKDRQVAELREQLNAFHQQHTLQQRQLQEQAATIQSLRVQLSSYGGDSRPALSARSDASHRSAFAQGGGDAGAVTPMSHARPSRSSAMTPRNASTYALQSGELVVSQTPRSALLHKSPSVGGGVAGVTRPAALALVTPRSASSHFLEAAAMVSSHCAEAAAAQQLYDKPLNSARGPRSQSQPGSASGGRSSAGGAAAPSFAAAGRSSSIPRLEVGGAAKLGGHSTSAGGATGGAAPSGSLSARPSSKYGSGSMAPPPAPATAARPATSRAGGMYGGSSISGGGSMVLSTSRGASVVLSESQLLAKAGKPPISSRATGGWK